jgi:hypothetical protein
MNGAKPQIIFALLCFLVFSCKKETSREIPYPGNGGTDTTGNGGIDTTGNGGGNVDSVAQFTLDSSNGSCSNAQVQGTYTSGIALTEFNTVLLNVQVTATGSWAISTSTVNGISFAGAGIFTDTGLQTILLIGAGIPGEFGATVIPVTAGGSSCGFAVTIAEN